MASTRVVECWTCGRTKRLSARGLCNACYKRLASKGLPLPPREKKSPDEWLALSQHGTQECWLWAGPLDRDGYGICSSGRAHRWSYERHVGPIPALLTLDHLCGRRSCVNPSHLEPVPIAVNVLRAETGITAVNARKVRCDRGHPFTSANTYVAPGRTGRQCRECKLLWQRRARAKPITR